MNLLEHGQLGPILLKYADQGIVEFDNGTFVCPLPGGSLRFLHKMFKPLKTTMGAEAALKEVPSTFLRFLSQTNGMTLFDNTFALYGSSPDISRSLELKDLRPISLEVELNKRREMLGTGRRMTWVPIGSVAGGEEFFEIEQQTEGGVRVRSASGASRLISSLDIALYEICTLLDSISDHRGLLDESGGEVDSRMRSFIATDFGDSALN